MVIAQQPFFTKVSKYGNIEYSGALNASYTFQPVMSFCLYLEPLSLWFSTRESIFLFFSIYLFFFFWGGGCILQTLYFKCITQKKINKSRTRLWNTGTQIGNFNIYHHTINRIKLMLCETVAKKEHFKNIQCGSYINERYMKRNKMQCISCASIFSLV